MTESKHIVDDLPAYALGVLDPAEALQIEAHLSECADCRAGLQAYLAVVEQLPLAVAMSAPGAEVKSKLLAQVTPRKLSTPSPRWQARLAGFFRAPQIPLRLAGLAAILLLIVSNLSLWQRANQLQRPSDFFIVELSGTEQFPDAKGVLIISAEGSEGTLVVEHLPELDESQQYQLWLIEDGQRTSGGVFSPRESGYGRLWVASPGSLLVYDAFGVTIEPAGGSPGPTGDKVLGSQ